MARKSVPPLSRHCPATVPPLSRHCPATALHQKRSFVTSFGKIVRKWWKIERTSRTCIDLWIFMCPSICFESSVLEHIHFRTRASKTYWCATSCMQSRGHSLLMCCARLPPSPYPYIWSWFPTILCTSICSPSASTKIVMVAPCVWSDTCCSC